MKVFTEQKIKEYIAEHPESRVALQDCIVGIKRSSCNENEDTRYCFGLNVECVGRNRYLFKIVNRETLIYLLGRVTCGVFFVRFIGNKYEYERINDLTTIQL